MNKYLCYDDDNAEESDAREVHDAYDASSAAEKFAEQQHTRGIFDSDTMDVMVKCEGETSWELFTVEKEIDIVFRAVGDV